MAVARAKGRLCGKQPKLSAKQQTELRRMHGTGYFALRVSFGSFGPSLNASTV
ncbi:MAG: hypothetical protein ACR2JX_07570 [Mycobacteriales bacterium]